MYESRSNKLDFLKACIACALWVETDGDETPLENHYRVEDIDPESLQKIRRDCDSFLKENKADLEEAFRMPWYTPSSAGHDFWLTRNGHGTGFGDRNLGPVGDRLTKASDEVGSSDLYVGDDGRLYFS